MGHVSRGSEIGAIHKTYELANQVELKLKEVEARLNKIAMALCKTLTKTDIKQLVVDNNGMTSIERSVYFEIERISLRLTQRIKELA